MSKTYKFMGSVLMVFALVACGGGGSSSEDSDESPSNSTTSINVSASLGLIRNANVRILDLNQVEIGETGSTGTSGTATLEIPSSYSDALIVEISGNSEAEYFDEAKGDFVQFLSGSKVRAIVPRPQSEIGVTILTEIATSMVEASNFMLATENSIDNANTVVRDMFLEGLGSITLPPTIIGEINNSLSSSPADLYALFLAVLAKMASDEVSQRWTPLIGQLRDEASSLLSYPRETSNETEEKIA